MQELHHANIVELHDVFSKKSNINLVIELAKTDLEVRTDLVAAWLHVSLTARLQHIIEDKDIHLSASDIKSYLLQSFVGLEYLHSHWILHRVGLCVLILLHSLFQKKMDREKERERDVDT